MKSSNQVAELLTQANSAVVLDKFAEEPLHVKRYKATCLVETGKIFHSASGKGIYIESVEDLQKLIDEFNSMKILYPEREITLYNDEGTLSVDMRWTTDASPEDIAEAVRFLEKHPRQPAPTYVTWRRPNPYEGTSEKE